MALFGSYFAVILFRDARQAKLTLARRPGQQTPRHKKEPCLKHGSLALRSENLSCMESRNLYPHMRGVRCLAVRLVVLLDDLFLDAPPWINRHPLLLGPGADLGGVATVVTGTAPPSPGATTTGSATTDALAPLNRPAFLDVGGKRLTKVRHVVLGQVDLVLLPVDRIGQGLTGFRSSVQVIDEDSLSRHDVVNPLVHRGAGG